MTQNLFIVDLIKKEIRLNPKTEAESCSVRQFYSYLMDVFDGPEYIRYDVPIKSVSKTKFKMVNGWSIEEKAKKHLKGNLH